MDETPERIATIAAQSHLTAVQLHTSGRRQPDKQITDRKVFLAIPADSVLAGQEEETSKSPLRSHAHLAAILIDSTKIGGSGNTFNWQALQPFVSSMSSTLSIVVAGGLTPANVTEAMDILKPWGVDVSSGVEASPGKKDPAKVRAFIQAVRDRDKNQ